MKSGLNPGVVRVFGPGVGRTLRGGVCVTGGFQSGRRLPRCQILVARKMAAVGGLFRRAFATRLEVSEETAVVDGRTTLIDIYVYRVVSCI